MRHKVTETDVNQVMEVIESLTIESLLCSRIGLENKFQALLDHLYNLHKLSDYNIYYELGPKFYKYTVDRKSFSLTEHAWIFKDMQTFDKQ